MHKTCVFAFVRREQMWYLKRHIFWFQFPPLFKPVADKYGCSELVLKSFRSSCSSLGKCFCLWTLAYWHRLCTFCWIFAIKTSCCILIILPMKLAYFYYAHDDLFWRLQKLVCKEYICFALIWRAFFLIDDLTFGADRRFANIICVGKCLLAALFKHVFG